MGSLIGVGSGESFQSVYHGPDSMAAQPSEDRPAVTAS